MRLTYLSILLLFILPVFLLTALSGTTSSYDAYFLNASEKLLKGFLPYRDFHFSYTPITLFFNCLSFIIFKTAILSSRLLVITLFLISSVLVYKIVFLSTKNKFYATVSLILLVTLGPSQVNFPSPWTWTLFTGLLSNYLFLKFIQKRENKYLLFAGIACFSVFLSEQFAGVMMVIPIAIFFSVKHARTISSIISFFYGYIWSIIFFIVYLLFTQSFPSFIYDLHRSFFTVGYYFSSPHTAQTVMLIIIMLVFSTASAVLLFVRRRFHLLFLPLFCASLIFSLILNGTYFDNTLYVSLIGIPIALYLRYNISTNVRVLILIVSFSLILLGFQRILATVELVLNKNLVYYQHDKVNILIDKNLKSTIEELEPVVALNSQSNGYIFVDPNDTIMYFLMNRKEPATEDSSNSDKTLYYKNAIGNIIAKRVKLLMIKKGNIPANTLKTLTNTNYNYYKTVNNIDIFLLRP